MTTISKRQHAYLYIYTKRWELWNFFIYKKPETFQKVGQFALHFYIQKARHLTLCNFLWNFEIGICIQKSWHFALRDVFIYKNPETSQKNKTICFTFLYTENLTLCVTLFFMKCLKLAHFYMQKTMHFALYFYTQKTMHIALRFYIQKFWHSTLYF